MIHYLDKPDTPEELLHFGVKGMKWGVRKGASASGSSSGSPAPKKRFLPKHRDTIVKGAVVTAAVLRVFGPVAMQAIAVRAEDQRRKAPTFTPGLQYVGKGKEAKANRKGVYNISTI